MIIECPDCDGEVEVGLYLTDGGPPPYPYSLIHTWFEVDTIEQVEGEFGCKCERTPEWDKAIEKRALDVAAEGLEPDGDY